MKKAIAFLIFFAVASCIDPYIPNLTNYKSLLVVEGLLTNENSSYSIRLSRTTREQDAEPERITDAIVNIIDNDGSEVNLKNCGDGYYKTDSTVFKGEIGGMYTLQVLTAEGEEYRSDECEMYPVANIEKIFYEPGEEVSGNEGETFKGLKILLNSSDAAGMNEYFRWTYEEDWKIIMPSTQLYTYAQINDTTFVFESVPIVDDACWKKNKSTDILTNTIQPGVTGFINNQKISFIAPEKSDRLTRQYSILVKQYSVSKQEYDFWNNLKKVSEAGGDIFASQPYTVLSNLHNVNDQGEMVLGYFEVSAVSQKRLYITAQELDPLPLPHFDANCDEIEKDPMDWPVPQTRPGWTEIYHMYVDSGDYIFVMPVLAQGTVAEGHVNVKNLVELVFARKICAFCELSGSKTKPDFWVDKI